MSIRRTENLWDRRVEKQRYPKHQKKKIWVWGYLLPAYEQPEFC